MKKLVSLLATLLLLTGFVTPASAVEVKLEVYQKTLSAWSSSATALTSTQRAQIKAAVDSNPNAEKFICTGIRYVSQPMSVNVQVRKRAKAACDYAKQLNPNLSTWYQNKPTQATSYSGKVLLTVKSPMQSFQQVLVDIRSYRKGIGPSSQQNEIEVFVSERVSPAVTTHYTNSVSRAAAFWAPFNGDRSLVKSVNIFRWDAEDDMTTRYESLGMPGYGDGWWARSSEYGGGTVSRDAQGYSHVFFRLNKAGGDFPYDDFAFHEVTHSYQDGLGKIADYTSVPCWFPEGYAMVVGLANSFADDKGNSDFYSSERRARAGLVRDFLKPTKAGFEGRLREAMDFTHANPQCNTLEPLFGYRLGMLVSEAWIYEFGFQRTVDFMSKLEGGDFAVSFEEEFGTPLSTWLDTRALPYVSEGMLP